MAEVIGVRFREVGKVYYFDPDGLQLKKGEYAIVETVRGIECGFVAMENRQIDESENNDTMERPFSGQIQRFMASVQKQKINQQRQAGNLKINVHTILPLNMLAGSRAKGDQTSFSHLAAQAAFSCLQTRHAFLQPHKNTPYYIT